MGFLKVQFCMCTLLYRKVLEIRDGYKIILLTNYRKYKLTKTQASKQNTLGGPYEARQKSYSQCVEL